MRCMKNPRLSMRALLDTYILFTSPYLDHIAILLVITVPYLSFYPSCSRLVELSGVYAQPPLVVNANEFTHFACPQSHS